MTESSSPPGQLPATPDGMDLLDLLEIVADNVWLLIFGPLLIGLITLGITFLITPTFTATTRLMPPQQQSSAALMLQNLGALGGLAGAAGIKNPNDQYVALLESETVANTLIDRFQLQERYEAELKVDARAVLKTLTAVSSGRDGLLTIKVNDRDPAFAAQLANAYVEEFSRTLNRLAVTEAQQRRVFFEAQFMQTKDKLTAAELALKGSGISPSVLKSNPEVAVRAVAELQGQIAALEVKLSAMRTYLSATAPDMKVAQNELAALRQQLTQVERSSEKPTAMDSDYVGVYRNFKYHESLFEMFARQLELARVDEAKEGALVQVVDIATVPERKSKPRKALITVVTTVASGILLLLFAIIRTSLRNARHDPGTSEKMRRLDARWSWLGGRS